MERRQTLKKRTELVENKSKDSEKKKEIKKDDEIKDISGKDKSTEKDDSSTAKVNNIESKRKEEVQTNVSTLNLVSKVQDDEKKLHMELKSKAESIAKEVITLSGTFGTPEGFTSG